MLDRPGRPVPNGWMAAVGTLGAMTSTRVGVVTDSTAYLPAGVAAQHGIVVVPLQVRLGDESYLEGVDLTPSDFAAWIKVPGHRPLTSRPSPAAFADAYASVDADQIVSVHMSGRLSGTAGGARLAAEQLTDRSVVVVDSRNTAMGLGFAVIAAARAAADGGTAAQVAAAAERAASRTRTVFYLDTLEHLRRGGRVGKTAAMLGGALSVKPLLDVVDGDIAPLEKVRTSSKAVARLVEIAALTAGRGAVDIAVHHLAAPEPARRVAAELCDAIPEVRTLMESELGPVVGAHVGPGCLGIVIHHR